MWRFVKTSISILLFFSFKTTVINCPDIAPYLLIYIILSFFLRFPPQVLAVLESYAHRHRFPEMPHDRALFMVPQGDPLARLTGMKAFQIDKDW